MNDLLAVLMSWAVNLSGYPAPNQMPEVVMLSHAEMVHAACNDQECQVLGWFPPGQRIYLDDRLLPLDRTYSSAVVVHEMVHYLQQGSGRFVHAREGDCEEIMAMEYQAYQVQRDFFTQYGVYQPIGTSLHASSGCSPAVKGP